MERRRRIAAYGVCRNGDGRLLMVRTSGSSNTPGRWLLPGGGIDHGEHPAAAVVREIAEETGLAVRVVALRDIRADVALIRGKDLALHHDRVIFDVAVCGGTLRDEPSGTTNRVRWVREADLAGMPLLSFVAEVLGVPGAAEVSAEPVTAEPTVRPPQPSADAVPRGQRFAAYGLVTDPAGRVLLARIAPGFPGAGRWHLPGGGTDFGEQPAAALLRELAEEADQIGRVVELLSVSHNHNPNALGPEGYPIDWHSVRAVYRVAVDVPVPPRVTEASGSTETAAWFRPAEAARLALTEITATALARYTG